MKMTQAPATTLQAEAPSPDVGQAQTAQPSNGSMQDQLAASAEDGELSGPRLGGPGSDLLRDTLGEPLWAVDGKNQWDFFQDSMKVVAHEQRRGDDRPGWYKGPGPRNLGENVRTPTQGYGGWRVLGVDQGAGIYEVGALDHVTGQHDFFLVSYTPARERQGIADHLRDHEGDPTLGSTLFATQRVLFGFINAVSPGNNLLKSATGRELDPFDPEFGEALTVWERFLEGVQGGAKLAPLAGEAMTKAEAIGWAVGLGAELGESIVDDMVARGFLDGASAPYVHAVLQLCGLSGQFAKWSLDGEAALTLADYLGSLSSLWGAGEEVLRGAIGDEAYEEFWVPNAGLIGDVYKDGGNIATIIETLQAVF